MSQKLCSWLESLVCCYWHPNGWCWRQCMIRWFLLPLPCLNLYTYMWWTLISSPRRAKIILFVWNFFFSSLHIFNLLLYVICIASDTLDFFLFFFSVFCCCCFLVIVVVVVDGAAVVAIAFYNFPHVAHLTNWTDIKWLKAADHKTYST